MASVGAVAAVNANTRIPPQTKKHYFGTFHSKLHVDQDIVRPYGVLRGRLVINNTKEIQCAGVRVQLDGHVILKYDVKVDNRSNVVQKMEGIFQGSESFSASYIKSPIRTQLMGFDDEEDRGHGDILILPGCHTYPFALTVPGEKLPAPFGSKFGSLQYKLTVYMKAHALQIQITESPVRFHGYNNLSEMSAELMLPLHHESGLSKSVFSSKKIITALLMIDHHGFLAGEEVDYKLKVGNSKGLAMKKVTVSLVRRVVYNVSGETKTTLLVLDSVEDVEPREELDIEYVGKLKVPPSCVPSYNVKVLYNITHLVQYQVKAAGQPGLMRGQVEIVIGTTREPKRNLMSRMNSLKFSDSTDLPSPAYSRSESKASLGLVSPH